VVDELTYQVYSSTLGLEEEANHKKAPKQERAPVPQRARFVFTVLLHELKRVRDTTAQLRARLDDKAAPSSSRPTAVSLEMNALRKALNEKEYQLEALQQQQFDDS
jgi:hypothetical protein